MYELGYEIKIGSYRLAMLESVKIAKSVLNLADTATVVCPASTYNDAISVRDKIKKGDAVAIRLGYDGQLETEFKGYLNAIQTEDNSITLDCIDELYRLKKTVANKEYKDTTLNAILHDLMKQVSSEYTIESNYEVGYDRFTVFNQTMYDVLQKIQDDTKANIFFREKTLHISEPYKDETGKTVIYDTRVNIETSDLKYVSKEDKKVKIEVEMTKPDGKKEKRSFGADGGEVVKKTVSGISESGLSSVAQNEYNLWNYDGFEGGFTGWLVPQCQPGDTVELRDTDGSRTGRYYVTGVEVEFSASGGKRKVTLGRKVNG
ncbi:MAG: hypothetical protein LBR66_04055 [Candidatus Symbiothrix sp.]|jgi:hypothetical protein|nr:hypothetical protein [Candidatus Symbiothrix sp.]